MATNVGAQGGYGSGSTMISPDDVPAGPPPEPHWLPVRNSVQALVEDIELVAPDCRVYIFCGEAHPDVYNDPDFLSVARDVKKNKRAVIDVITGPILLLPEARDETNGLLQLLEDGTINEMYHRRAQDPSHHFRVVETDLVDQKAYRYYVEAPHHPLLPLDDRLCENLDRLHPADVQRRARQAIALFNSWKARAVLHGNTGAERLPLLATPSELDAVLLDAAKHDIDTTYLDERQLYKKWSQKKRLLTPFLEFARPTKEDRPSDGQW